MIDYKELGFDENLITLDDYAIKTSVIGQKSVIPDRLADGITQVPARYVFYISGGVIHVRNGATGKIDYSGTVASTVIQDVLTYMFDNTLYGRLFFTAGTYNMAKQIAIPDKVWIDGEGEATLFFVPNSTVFAQPAVGDPGLISTTTAENAENYSLFRNWDYAGETQLGNVGIKITNIQIDMNKANNSKPAWANAYYGIGIAFNWIKRPKIENVYIKNCFAEGIAIWGPANQYIGPTSWPNVNGSIKNSLFEACGDGTDSIMAGVLVDYHAKNVVISGNVFDGCYNGVSLEDHCQENIVANNVMKDCTGYNIHLASDDGFNVIIGNKIYNPGISGIYGSNVGRNCVVHNNLVYSAADDGIYFEGTSHSIVGNIVINSGGSGLYLKSLIDGIVVGNILYNNGENSGKSYRDGCTLIAAASRNLIVGNWIGNETGITTQQYGVKEATQLGSTPDFNYIFGNYFSANTVSPVLILGGSTKTIHNYGYVTENTGTAIVASGYTTTTPSHGLSYTPTLQEISLTPTNNIGNATKFWITNPTSSQFTVNVDVDPGVSTATFGWNIRKN